MFLSFGYSLGSLSLVFKIHSVRFTKFGDLNVQSRIQRYNKAGINGKRFSSLPYSSLAIQPRGAASSYSQLQGSSWTPPALRARVVSASYKATFSGSTLNDQGIFYNFTEPNHENLFGQTLTNYAAAFTSLKAQRIATRGLIENTVVPVQRQQMELSQGYEQNQTSDRLDYSTSYDNGSLVSGEGASEAAARTAVLVAPLAAQAVTNDFNPVVNSILQCPASQGDWQMYVKALMTTLYPLSRQNACTLIVPESNNDGTNPGRAFSVAATGILTWTAQVPEPGIYLCKMGVSGTSFTGPQALIAFYNNANTTWYAFDLLGLPIYQTIAATNATLVAGAAFPPIIAATVMQGLQPGSTFHVEAIIHCEYSGSQNQGMTQPCVPDPIHQGIILQAVSNARELAAKNEHARPQDAFVQSIVQTAAHHAPELS